MKINNFNLIPFQKKLIAHAGFIKSNKPNDCKIYELDSKDDAKYLDKVKNRKSWDNCYYGYNVEFCVTNFSRQFDNSRCFVMEDDKENCIGYTIIDEFEDRNEVIIVETIPKARFIDGKRTKKYIGETLINFLTLLTSKQNKDYLVIKSPEPWALDFYMKNCHCERFYGKEPILYGKNADILNEQNKEHTKKEISFIA